MFPGRSQRKSLVEPDIVPILNLMTCVIFFLVLATVFTQLTKLTLPPSSVSINDDPSARPPLSAKLIVAEADRAVRSNQIQIILQWTGDRPGHKRVVVPRYYGGASLEIESAVTQLIQNFLLAHPNEKTVQLGLTPNLTYQELISTMDGVKRLMPDIVLISYRNVQTNTYIR